MLEQARFYIKLADHQTELSQFAEAEENYSRGIGILTPLGASQPLIHALTERSYVRYIKTYDKSFYCPDRVLAAEYARELQDQDTLVKALTQLAFCYNNRAQFESGLKLLQEALAIAYDAELTPNRIAMIYNATALIYQKIELNAEAYHYLLKAYQKWASVDDKIDMLSMLHGLVASAIKLGDWELADKHVEEMFALANRSPEHTDFTFFAYFNAGRAALAKRELSTAVEQLNVALARQEDTAEKFFVWLTHATLAETHLRSGDWEQANEQAEAFLANPNISDDLGYWKALCEAIIAAKIQDGQTALLKVLSIADSERKQKIDFINDAALRATHSHSEKLTQFENQLLTKEVEINRLALANERDQRKIAYLTITVIVVFTLGLSAALFFLIRSRRLLQHRAQTDFLTGVANRRYIMEQAERIIDRAAHRGDNLSVILFDIDHFKRINDTYGHQAGDKAIKQIADVTIGSLRPGDILGRVGGEEFLVVLPAAGQKQALEVAERLRNAVACHPLDMNKQKIQVTISLGVSTLKSDCSTLTALMHAADDALYQAKGAGRNCTQVASQPQLA
ncbi:GGDEF domain-containing protein [Corallincola platygyrae]